MDENAPAHPNTHLARWASMLSLTKDTPATGTGICELCARETNAITKHHLYPRAARRDGAAALLSDQQWGNAAIQLCWPCHCIIHRIIPHQVMASSFNTLELLKQHRGVQAWLAWALAFPIADLHGLMIQRPVKQLRQRFNHLLGPIEQALDSIWREHNGEFPQWKDTKKRRERRPIALRKAIIKLVKSRDVQKPEIRVVMRQRPEWQEWCRWVYS